MVDGVTSTGEAVARTTAGVTGLASNFETFLQLLTTQLRNQDPLSPLDSNEFTAQLTQMSGVEQQLLTNDLLTSLLAAQQSGGLSSASTYIGKDATAVWSATELVDGQAQWSYELAGNAGEAKLEILDGTGNVVWTGDAPEKSTGVHDVSWDGNTSAGGQLPDGGVYTLKITAKDGTGSTVDSQVLTRGRITGVEIFDGQPYLTIGNAIVPLASVIALEEQAAAAPPPATPANDDDEETTVASMLSAMNPLKLFS